MSKQILEIRNKKNGSKGLFSTENFPKNEVILRFNGKIISTEEMQQLPADKSEALLQVGPTSYLDLSGDMSFYLAHSCNPNAAIKVFAKQACLISLRDIKPSEEICFDYSLSSTEDKTTWSMVCQCGQWNCRKHISGFHSMTADEQKKYAELRNIPSYIKK